MLLIFVLAIIVAVISSLLYIKTKKLGWFILILIIGFFFLARISAVNNWYDEGCYFSPEAIGWSALYFNHSNNITIDCVCDKINFFDLSRWGRNCDLEIT